ncbi:pilus assembly protein PilO [Candidatus Magnetoovum chiemensis]|nr:pilus assembly protein PilO [Candidatus Magnetoovum chiemensis]
MKLNLSSLHPGLKILINVLPVIIVGCAFFFLIYKPQTEKIQKISNEIMKIGKEIEEAKKKVALLPGVKEQLAKAESRYAEIKKQLPEEQEISDLLKQVSDLGKDAGLRISTWKPMGKTNHPSKILYEIPVQVTMQGTYHRLGVFLGTLTGLDRIVNIVDIKLKGSNKMEEGATLSGPVTDKDETLLSIKFKGSTFSSIPEAEQQAIASGAGKKGKGAAAKSSGGGAGEAGAAKPSEGEKNDKE